MGTFWIWLLLLGASWALALTQFSTNWGEMPLRVLGSGVFFALFFLAPLFRKTKWLFTVLLCSAALVAIFVFWPERGSSPNLYTLLIFTIIAGKAVYRLQPIHASVVGGILLAGAIIPSLAGHSFIPVSFIVLYAFLLAVGFVVYHKLLVGEREVKVRNEALLTEYRKMKRRLATDEKNARQEERTQIAREIHDSVGHKLTALLMQLEVFRMQAKGENEHSIKEIKMLAKESLEETRNAVKVLKQDDVGGLSAIMRLIRKLEAENFIRVQFTVKQGALSVPLSNEQSIAIYRAVQEALTNSMRHGNTKEVEIVFDVPGGTIFRFEVTNPITHDLKVREGFGLTSMRERMEQARGQLEIKAYGGRFVVRGTFPLLEEREMNE